jgi:hypothetical protein
MGNHHKSLRKAWQEAMKSKLDPIDGLRGAIQHKQRSAQNGAVNMSGLVHHPRRIS